MSAASDPGRSLVGSAHEAVPGARPSRPAAIELAAATLIAGGIFRLVAVALALAGQPAEAPVPPLIAVGEVLLQALTVVTGALVRTGRAWVFSVNVLAVITFLEVIRLPSPLALLFTVLFGLSFAATFIHKPWFDALGEWRAIRPEARA